MNRAGARQPQSKPAGSEGETQIMDGMMMSGWHMGAMGIVWILVVVALVLAIAALVKYLRR